MADPSAGRPSGDPEIGPPVPRARSWPEGAAGPLLLIRADANGQIGTGHVMRCLALAQAWRAEGGRVLFASAHLPAALEARLEREAVVVHRLAVPAGSALDAEMTRSLAVGGDVTWIAVDGYAFGSDFLDAVRPDSPLGSAQADGRGPEAVDGAPAPRLLVLDDEGHAGRYAADLVLNQNIYASERLYAHRLPSTRLLLGCRFVLLRREFWSWRGRQREVAPRARRVLITLGGADPDNVSLRVLAAFRTLGRDDLDLLVVVGAGNPHGERLAAFAADLPCPARLVHNAGNMPELMAWADLAVSAGGTTSWELAFMGLPGLALALADNQRPVVAGLAAAGVSVDGGWPTDLEPEALAGAIEQLLADVGARAEMARRGQELVDGRGGERVVRAMRESRNDRVEH